MTNILIFRLTFDYTKTGNKMKALLKSSEESNHMVKHNVAYNFRYDEQDNFYILLENSGWIEECSTAFDFQ